MPSSRKEQPPTKGVPGPEDAAVPAFTPPPGYTVAELIACMDLSAAIQWLLAGATQFEMMLDKPQCSRIENIWRRLGGVESIRALLRPVIAMATEAEPLACAWVKHDRRPGKRRPRGKRSG